MAIAILVIGLTSSQISAKPIDNRVPLDPGPPTEEPPPITPALFSGFEKGDCIFRKLDFTFAYLLGHAGLYWHWAPRPGQITPDPNIWGDHITMEELGVAWTPREPRKFGQLDYHNFKKFYETAGFWGVGAHKLHYLDRQKLVDIAKAQTELHPRFGFWGDYKRPGISFRCDGFVEWCYEQVGLDIVPNDWWKPMRGRNWLTPARQWYNSAVRIGKFEELRYGTKENPADVILLIDGEIAPIEEGRYKVSGEVEVKVYASDLDKDNDGSGITRLELWIGEPDDTPSEMPGYRLLEDDTDYPNTSDDRCWHDYTYTWNTTEFPNGNYSLKTIAFDQAGNTKSAYCEIKIVNIRITELMRAINEREAVARLPQTEFYNRTTGESLGIPDGGVNVPALDALDGYPFTLQYILDLREPIQRLASDYWLGYPHYWSGLYDNGIPKAYDWGPFSPYNLYNIAMGEGWDWKSFDEGVYIEEILKCIEKLNWVMFQEFWDSRNLLKYFASRYVTKTEAWAACVASSPLRYGLVNVEKSLYKITERWWHVYIRRGYAQFETRYLFGKPALQSKYSAVFDLTGDTDEILQIYKNNWYPIPNWAVGTQLLYEWHTLAPASYHRVIDIDPSTIESNDMSGYAWKIKDDEIEPISPQKFMAQIRRFTAYLLVKPHWNYPTSP